MTVPLKVKVAQQEMMIRFCLVPSFPYYLCIGLRDMMKVPHIRGALFSVFKLNNWKGIDETRSDEALLNEGKEQLRRLTGTDDAVMFEKVWSVFERHKSAWLRPRSAGYRGPSARVETVGAPREGRRRPLSPLMKEEVDRQLDSQLNSGVIEASKSEWASPIHVVKKKDGGSRTQVSYMLGHELGLLEHASGGGFTAVYCVHYTSGLVPAPSAAIWVEEQPR
eukprot:GHVN01041647.1.p1 GENE.GHVN01041647.1~~GHVN01041647.1.p1  ORF type:complete len:222 (+),score=35.49 GHVN01041647.1:1365-2030(+)